MTYSVAVIVRIMVRTMIPVRVSYHPSVILSRRRTRSAGGRSKDPLSTCDGFREKARTQGVLRRPPALRVLRQPQDDSLDESSLLLFLCVIGRLMIGKHS